MSASPLKVDMRTLASLCPLSANSCREQMQQRTSLFDHFVGAGEHRRQGSSWEGNRVLARGAAIARTHSRKVCTAGLIVRCLNVTIPTCQGRTAKSTGRTLSEKRSALKRSTEPDSAETKRLVASRLTRW